MSGVTPEEITRAEARKRGLCAKTLGTDDVCNLPKGHRDGCRASQPSVDEMGGAFEGGPDSVTWLREQRGEGRDD